MDLSIEDKFGFGLRKVFLDWGRLVKGRASLINDEDDIPMYYLKEIISDNFRLGVLQGDLDTVEQLRDFADLLSDAADDLAIEIKLFMLEHQRCEEEKRFFSFLERYSTR